MKLYEIYVPNKINGLKPEDATSSIKLNDKELYVVAQDNGNYAKVEWPMSKELLDGSVIDALRGLNNEAYIPLHTFLCMKSAS